MARPKMKDRQPRNYPIAVHATHTDLRTVDAYRDVLGRQGAVHVPSRSDVLLAALRAYIKALPDALRNEVESIAAEMVRQDLEDAL